MIYEKLKTTSLSGYLLLFRNGKLLNLLNYKILCE